MFYNIMFFNTDTMTNVVKTVDFTVFLNMTFKDMIYAAFKDYMENYMGDSANTGITIVAMEGKAKWIMCEGAVIIGGHHYLSTELEERYMSDPTVCWTKW